MKMMPESMGPGATPKMMVDMMLRGWREKHGDMPEAAPMPMAAEPPPPLPSATAGAEATGGEP